MRALFRLWSGAPTRKPAQQRMQVKAVTNFASVEAEPALSPDGSLVRIANDTNVETRPRWSPESGKILFVRLDEWGLWDTWGDSCARGSERKLAAADPAWSPDAHRIV
jgi:hypothetical protein